MSKYMKIGCPPADLSTKDKIKYIQKEFEKWLLSDEMRQLVSLFNDDKLPPALSLIEFIPWIKGFASNHWDYRRMQKEAMTKEGEAARWLIRDDEHIQKNEALIFDISKQLGLVESAEPSIKDADYILPLGGAKFSNLKRPELAKKIIDTYNNLNSTIVALSTYRPISESERDSIDTYAKGATFEFDAIISGMSQVFELQSDYRIDSETFDNTNSNYAICTFNKNYKGIPLYVLSAPSSSPETRRANSADCFEFFFSTFKVKSGAKIINCTSQIYSAYQHVRSLFFAMKYNVEFDTIGVPSTISNTGTVHKDTFFKASNYVQEIKSSIDAIYDFSKVWY